MIRHRVVELVANISVFNGPLRTSCKVWAGAPPGSSISEPRQGKGGIRVGPEVGRGLAASARVETGTASVSIRLRPRIASRRTIPAISRIVRRTEPAFRNSGFTDQAVLPLGSSWAMQMVSGVHGGKGRRASPSTGSKGGRHRDQVGPLAKGRCFIRGSPRTGKLRPLILGSLA